MNRLTRLVATGLAISPLVRGIALDVNDTESIKNAASIAAYKMVTMYPGNRSTGIPGLLGDPYYWWEAGAMFGALVDYWHYTGDATYNEITTQGLLWQVGADNDYMPVNQTKSLGNDDQAFWGIAAMRAAEVNYPNPPSGKPGWLALAQAVFNTQLARWNTQACGGGLKWQIFTFNNGYDYRNSISNGLFFNLGARLAAYTGNKTYSEWATKTYDWSTGVGLVDNYDVYDGSDDTMNCTQKDHIQWTYNAGIYMYGCATMWNITQDDIWKDRAIGFWNRSAEIFFAGNGSNILYEAACEPVGNCKVDQLSFKGFLSRWASQSTKVAPFLYDMVKPLLVTSAQGAAQNCVGGGDGTTCGTKWYEPGWDGTTGVGQQMCALETFQSLLVQYTSGPLTNATGGTSEGDPAAGTQEGGTDYYVGHVSPITAADRAAAAFLTIVMLVAILGGGWFLVSA